MKEKTNSRIYVGLVVILIIALIFIFKKPVERTNLILQQVEGFSSTLGGIEGVMELFEERQNQLIKQAEERDRVAQKRVDSVLLIVVQLKTSVDYYKSIADENAKKVDSLLSNITPRPDTPPSDYEECVSQLDTAYETVDILTEVVEVQTEQIVALEASNLDQALIINQHEVVIEIKDEQIKEWRQLVHSTRRWGNFKAGAAIIITYIIVAVL